MSGIASSGRAYGYGNQGYNNGYNGQYAYANHAADLRFTCKVNTRGQVSDVNISRNQVAYRGYQLVGKVSQQVLLLLAFAFFAFGSSPMEERAIASSFNLWSTKELTEPERLVPRHGVRLPVIDYTGPTGGRERKSGIVAGVSIAPNTTVGVGFFNTRRAKSGLAPDPQFDRTRRNSKKAAIGISLKF